MYYVFCSACQDEEWIEEYETMEEVKIAYEDHKDVIYNIITGEEINFNTLELEIKFDKKKNG